MVNCGVCGETIDLPRKCELCGEEYCHDHQLPENHNCVGLYSATTHGPDFRDVYSEDTPVEKDSPDAMEVENTVGSSSTPDYPSSPDVEVKNAEEESNDIVGEVLKKIRQKLQRRIKRTKRGIRHWKNRIIGFTKWLTVKTVKLALIIAIVSSAAISLGMFSATDIIGDPGESIDNTLQKIPHFIANVTNSSIIGNGTTGGPIRNISNHTLNTSSIFEKGQNVTNSTIDELTRSDPDNDTLASEWEETGEKGDIELSDADPKHKDLYVVFAYSSGAALKSEEKAQLRQIWGNMEVSNPDGNSGIDLHIVIEYQTDDTFEFTRSSGAEEEFLRWYDRFVPPDACGIYHLVVLTPMDESTGYSGYGDSPGYVSVVDSSLEHSYSNVEYSPRVRAITHELLHNVVGEISGEHVTGEPSHSTSGWLSHVESAEQLDENSKLSEAVSTQLSNRGFKQSEYYDHEVCS